MFEFGVGSHTTQLDLYGQKFRPTSESHGCDSLNQPWTAKSVLRERVTTDIERFLPLADATKRSKNRRRV